MIRRSLALALLPGSKEPDEPRSWEAPVLNWQSEFLAVGSFAVLVVYLRQRG